MTIAAMAASAAYLSARHGREVENVLVTVLAPAVEAGTLAAATQDGEMVCRWQEPLPLSCRTRP